MDSKASLSDYITKKIKCTDIESCIIVLFGSATINWDFANDLDIMIVARDRDEIQKIVNVLNLSLFCKESYGKSVDVFAMPADMFYKKLLRGDVQLMQCILDSYDLYSSGIFVGLQYLQACGIIKASPTQVRELLAYCSNVAHKLEQQQYKSALDAFMHLRTAYRFLIFATFINADMALPTIRDFSRHKEFLIEKLGNTTVENYFKFEEFASLVTKNVYQYEIYPTEQQISCWIELFIDANSKMGAMYR